MSQRSINFTSRSGNVVGITYDDETQDLTVEFNHGGTYVYSGVPESTAMGFESAPSAGEYLNQFIKGLFNYDKIA